MHAEVPTRCVIPLSLLEETKTHFYLCETRNQVASLQMSNRSGPKMARLLATTSFALAVPFLLCDQVQAFHNIVLPPSSYISHGRQKSLIARVSTEEQIHQEEVVSYIDQRGDGSTGGGGLPMPKKRDESVPIEDDELRRPKVCDLRVLRFFALPATIIS